MSATMISFLWSVTHWEEPQKQSDSNVCWCRSWWFYITTRLSNSLLSKESPQYVSFAYRDKSLSFTSHICMIICALPQHRAVIHIFDTGYYPLQTDMCTETREGQNKNISALLSWEYTFLLHIKSPKQCWGFDLFLHDHLKIVSRGKTAHPTKRKKACSVLCISSLLRFHQWNQNP